MHFLFNRLTCIRVVSEGWSSIFSTRIFCADTWGTEGSEPPPPSPPTHHPRFVREGVPWWVGEGPFSCFYLLIFSFIPSSIGSPVMNITVFFTLFTVNFKLKGIFYFTLSFPSHCKHLWLLWKDTFQFDLVQSCKFFKLKSNIFWERMVTSCIKLNENRPIKPKKIFRGMIPLTPSTSQTYFTV